MCRPNSPDQRIWRQSWTYQLVWSFAPSCWAWCCFWVDEGTSILAHWRIPAVSNTRRTVLGLSGWTPVPYWDSSTSVCQGFFWTFRITANFSLRVKPLLIPLRVGAPNDAPLSFKCFLINRLTVVRGIPCCREIAELLIPDLFRSSMEVISGSLYSWRVILDSGVWLCEVDNTSVFKLTGFFSIYLVWFLATWPSHDAD